MQFSFQLSANRKVAARRTDNMRALTKMPEPVNRRTECSDSGRKTCMPGRNPVRTKDCGQDGLTVRNFSVSGSYICIPDGLMFEVRLPYPSCLLPEISRSGSVSLFPHRRPGDRRHGYAVRWSVALSRMDWPVPGPDRKTGRSRWVCGQSFRRPGGPWWRGRTKWLP